MSQLDFTKGNLRSAQVDMAVDSYFAFLQAGLEDTCSTAEIGSNAVLLCKVNDITLLACFSDDKKIDDDQLESAKILSSQVKERIGEKSARKVRGIFPSLAREQFQKAVSIFFVSHHYPEIDNKSGQAVQKLLNSKHSSNESYSVNVGPFSISYKHGIPSEITGYDSKSLEDIDVLVFIISNPIWPESIFDSVIRRFREHPDIPILVVPGSDDYLEITRKYEEKYEVILCDSVSDDPHRLLVSVLAYSGLSFEQPEIAMQKWRMDSIEASSDEHLREKEELLGHQAFFVIDKQTGRPVYTYFYDQQSVLLDRIPNVVAAISALSMDPDSSTKTSVVRTGNLNYAIIERNDLIFTLITGLKEDADAIRSQFAFLPDLYFDEAPDDVIKHENPYSAPPFTLKLLATLPPEPLPGRLIPQHKNEPEWEKFKEESVRDFIQAIWHTIDGDRPISRMAVGDGPLLVIGALHLLKSLGAINMKIDVRLEDIPVLQTTDPSHVKLPYTGIESVLDYVNGDNTLGDICNHTNIEIEVLRTVFGMLYNRGVIDFLE